MSEKKYLSFAKLVEACGIKRKPQASMLPLLKRALRRSAVTNGPAAIAKRSNMSPNEGVEKLTEKLPSRIFEGRLTIRTHEIVQYSAF